MGNTWRESYKKRWQIYDIFSKREDYPDAAWKSIIQEINFHGKIVFEMGCGTGKYTKKIAQLADSLFANDISEVMIQKTQETCKDFSNITYICESAHESGLPDHSVDIVFSAWGYVAGDPDFAMQLEKEFNRILKPGGTVWLLDNYYEGEFTRLRGKNPQPGTPMYPEQKYGYHLVKKINTYFQFESVEEASDIFGFLFGENAQRTILKNNTMKIGDTIALMKKAYNGME